jgi:ABC-type phosphate transport system permease subunit
MSEEKVQLTGRAPRTKGEVKVWLTAAGLATGLAMIAALLLLITYHGLRVFWPDPVLEYSVKDESGQEVQIAGVPLPEPPRRSAIPGSVPDDFQIFTGNKDVYSLGFRFLEEESVTRVRRPEGIRIAERLEYGPAIFYPVSLRFADGTKVQATSAEFDDRLKEAIKDARKRWSKIHRIEKSDIGAINRRLRKLEMGIRSLEDDGAPATEVQALKEAVAEEQATFEELADQMNQLRERQTQDRLSYRLASGEEREQSVGDLVFYYAPNELGWFGKTGVFLHRVWEFLTEEPREANMEGGVFPAIFGTFVMTLLMAILVTPFGVIAAIYLREYARQGLLVRAVRICVNNLAGVPSIVFGVFGLGFFIYGVGGFIDGGVSYPMAAPWWWLACALTLVTISIGVYLSTSSRVLLIASPLKRRVYRKIEGGAWVVGVLLLIVSVARCPYFEGFFSDSLPAPTFGTGGILWASLTLALMTLPVVIVATEEALVAVPRGVREAALACGASKWQMIQRVVLPGALPGVMTGIILAMARGAGEVAPLMITGVVKLAPSLPIDLTAPFIHAERKFMHLGFHIYDLGFQSPDSEAAKPMVFATTLLLILLVVALNLFAIYIRARLRQRFQAAAF